ncbi:PREDICTED: uncharacterized protein LOC109154178 [Ipomoea nil]|uniref:uncharacterized protein LOC109154178 n=1 Tax=Ipomoea nil TaxID=35883 RepID=UPI000901F25F|nr:PREDICTED: uncharacterized protein LOC109154178 [Ipomoea nil]
MRSIDDVLALAQCPISDEDMVVYILTQLEDEYSSIVSVVRIRDKPISLGELADALTDHERQLTEVDDARQSLLATANASQRGPLASRNIQHSTTDRRSRNNTNNTYGNNRPNWSHNSNTRPGVVCQFCHLDGLETRVCRKLARFLKAHNVFPVQAPTFPQSQSPAANSTVGWNMPWMFESGASHHDTPDMTPLHTFTEYNGPDGIRLGNGNSLNISHIGQSSILPPSSVLTLKNVLCVPHYFVQVVYFVYTLPTKTERESSSSLFDWLAAAEASCYTVDHGRQMKLQ